MKRFSGVPDGFIALATFVRGVERATVAPPSVAETLGEPPPAPDAGSVCARYAHADELQELALMRLAAFEAFERANRSLLEALAADVLGRELALAPAAIEALVENALARSHELDPVSLVVAPCDAELLRTTLPVRIDPALEAGDLIVEVRDGSLESRLRFRLGTALERALLGPA